MKKLLIAAALLVSVLGAKAQGTVDTTSQANPIFDVGGTVPLSGTTYTMGLYWAPTATGTYTLISPTSNFATGGGAGFWLNPGGTVAGQPGGTSVSIIARAWNTTAGNFTTASTVGGNKSGSSVPITVTLGGAGSPPSLPADLSAMASFSLTLTTVPEPSTIALGILGAGALLLRRRK